MRPRLFIATLCALPSCAFQVSDLDLAQQARAELLACRYEHAVELYRQVLAQKPTGDSYYGLTRALLRSHRAMEAYVAAEEGVKREPRSAGAQTPAGLAMFRKGELAQAEDHFRAARELDATDCRAMSGLAAIYSAVSKPRTARDLLRQAYLACPDDPALMLARANTLRGSEHIAALEQALAAIDPASEDARGLRAHIASDRAIGDRKLRRLVSTYEPARIKLTEIMQSPTRLRGFGVRVQFNQRQTATLLLDTGASGISLAPKIAQKAGIELLSDESSEAKGIGDKKPQDSFSYLASEVRIGPVVFADHPVRVFRAAKDSDIEGLIGADVFQRFIVQLDFPALQMELEPYQTTDDDPQDASALAEGFHRVVRAGSHLLIATFVNQSKSKFFLIDSGSFSNLIDSDAAREFTGVRQDAFTNVRGVQGKVNRVSRAEQVTLVFAGFRQDNPNLIAISLESPSDSMGIGITGVLGMPVLRQLKLAIDYRARAVRFGRP
jgi:tetratricopeptide (TPR) repeat protein